MGNFIMFLIIVSWILAGFIVGVLQSIQINNDVHGYKHYKTDDIPFTLILTFLGYISLITYVLIVMGELIVRSINVKVNDKIIWSEKKKEEN